MLLQKIKLVSFKNYSDAEVEFCRNVNCLVGNNGVGKTNLLDAAYYLSFCKSYFNPLDSQNIRHGDSSFAVHGYYVNEAKLPLDGNTPKLYMASCIFRNGLKQMRWDGKACKNLAEHIGRIPLVMVSPNDQSLITGGSELRRKFIDGVISQTNKDYLSHLLDYQKALDQRNRLLKQFFESHSFDESHLQLWDQQLVQHGSFLILQRIEFLSVFTPIFNEYYKWISRSDAHAALSYDASVSSVDTFAQQLEANHRRDSLALHTTIGPHRDDIDLKVADYSVKKYGSQGQQKTFLLALKLAQFEYITRHNGSKPILLLDDVFDKLDMLRVQQLINLVGSDRFGQVFVSDTQPGRVQLLFDELPNTERRIFNVSIVDGASVISPIM